MAGWYSIFAICKWEIKKSIKSQVKKRIPNSKLTVIRISKASARRLNWIEQGKEFEYGHRMYDIVRMETYAGGINYYCIDDEEEKQLFRFLDKMVQDFMAHSKRANSLKTLEKTWLAVNSVPLEDFHSSKHNGVSYTQYKHLFYKPVYLDIILPPPKLSA